MPFVAPKEGATEEERCVGRGEGLAWIQNENIRVIRTETDTEFDRGLRAGGSRHRPCELLSLIPLRLV